MKPGSVIVDVAIDQGGCIATARPTIHSDQHTSHMALSITA
jgi:alanine dehydrogenase